MALESARRASDDYPVQPGLLRPSDVARILGLSRHDVWHQIAKGALPALKLWPGPHGPVRIEPETVAQFDPILVQPGRFYLAAAGSVLIDGAPERIGQRLTDIVNVLPVPSCVVAVVLGSRAYGDLVSIRREFSDLRLRGHWYQPDASLWQHMMALTVPRSFENWARVTS